MDALVVCIDHTRASVQVDTAKAWFPRNSTLSVELSGQRDWSGVLGAVSEDADSFYCQCDEYITSDHARKFILALDEVYEGDLIIVLDGASYVQAKNVTELSDRDGIDFLQLPSYSPESNPVEESWRQLKNRLRNQFFESKAELEAAIKDALTEIVVPYTSNYF